MLGGLLASWWAPMQPNTDHPGFDREHHEWMALQRRTTVVGYPDRRIEWDRLAQESVKE